MQPVPHDSPVCETALHVSARFWKEDPRSGLERVVPASTLGNDARIELGLYYVFNAQGNDLGCLLYTSPLLSLLNCLTNTGRLG